MAEKKSNSQKMLTVVPLIDEDCAQLAHEIEMADGAEVLSAATCSETGVWTDLRVLARGTEGLCSCHYKRVKTG